MSWLVTSQVDLSPTAIQNDPSRNRQNLIMTMLAKLTWLFFSVLSIIYMMMTLKVRNTKWVKPVVMEKKNGSKQLKWTVDFQEVYKDDWWQQKIVMLKFETIPPSPFSNLPPALNRPFLCLCFKTSPHGKPFMWKWI